MAVDVRLGTALEVKILGLRQTLSIKEQAVANFLLSDPKEFISLSISVIAQRCGVSETVIIRLYRKLGFEGFHEFKIEVAQSLTETTEQRLGDIKAGDSVADLKAKIFAISRQAIEDAEASTDANALTAARDALLAARRVIIVAMGGSAPVAFDLQHKLLKLGIVATVMTDSHLQVMTAAVMDKSDVLLAISHSGNSRDIIDALHSARAEGARTVLITGFPNAPATKEAEISLIAPCRETKFQTDAMTSRLVQLVIVDTLYVAMQLSHKTLAQHVHETSRAAAKKKL